MRDVASSSFSDVARRARQALSALAPRRFAIDGFASAAVLVPILRRPAGATLLFTQRSRDVAKHAGQISFPGGASEAGETAPATALREASEEVGLEPGRLEIVGALDDRPTVSAFVVTPVVALCAEPPEAFRPHAGEVTAVFETPLSRLLDPACYRCEWWDVARVPEGLRAKMKEALASQPEDLDDGGARYKVHFFDPDPGSGRVIWGLTARIVRQLLDLTFRE